MTFVPRSAPLWGTTRMLVSAISRSHAMAPSLVSQTLESDDVGLAKRWLAHPEWWNRADEVDQYHARFAEWNGSRFAFSFMSGREALSAIIFALDLQPGDEVILPGYTCVVVPNAFRFAGIKPVFADIELDTYGLDAAAFRTRITKRTRAVVLHHLYGLVCRDYEEIVSIARKHGLKVIEDCAHSTGAAFMGRRVGHLGDAAFYSSEHSKVFTTFKGGVAATDDETIGARLEYFHQQSPYPDRTRVRRHLQNILLDYYTDRHPQRWLTARAVSLLYGRERIAATSADELRGQRPAAYGEKMPAPIAALGVNQLRKVDKYNDQRRQTAKVWNRWCLDNGYEPPTVLQQSSPVYLRYPVLVEASRKEDRSWAVRDLGVNPGVWFISHLHPVPVRLPDCPKAEYAVEHCINLPTLGVSLQCYA